MTGYQRIFNKIVIVSAAINISLNYVLIPIWGIEGAAIASLISMVFWNITSVIYIKKRFGFYIGFSFKK